MQIRLTLVLVVAALLLPLTSAHATKASKNCIALGKVYPGGVALPGAVNAGGMTRLTPKFDKKLYEANKKSDRDKDGIGCEK
jgi:hypothetical protein